MKVELANYMDFFRDSSGHEVDMVVNMGPDLFPVDGIHRKSRITVKLSRKR
ncbi:MAG: hypothetical protein OEV42_02930 [Deltaproteobacteria bacterium]|nr:hypothetical protein [Deltaproteobacteria bacterium]